MKAIPGNDGRIKRMDVQTVNGVLLRPVTKVAVLDVAVGSIAEESKQQNGSGSVEIP